MRYSLRTIGHATLILMENGTPLLATDPWLIGSTYWRSWWLEKYPTSEDLALVRAARFIYITHSHPDHFHWPSLRRLGPRTILNPRFPRYAVPEFLEQNGFGARTLEPWQWYKLGNAARLASVPCPIDDSVLLIDTPGAAVVNLNDATPSRRTLLAIRAHVPAGKKIVVLKSYSPASIGIAMFRDGVRVPLKTKRDYAETAQRLAETLGATHFIPFASQAFFNREDSRWANEHKVVYEDLLEHWQSGVTLCKPFTDMDLDTADHQSTYSEVNRQLADEQRLIVVDRQKQESSFHLPDDLDVRLKTYLDQIPVLPLLFRRGIGWKLSTSGAQRFYRSRTRTVERAIPAEHDLIITVPDQVLYEALQNGVLTDLGITMFVRVDTRVPIKLAYSAFLLMGLRDYGYFRDVRSFARFTLFYAPYFIPLGLRRRAHLTPALRHLPA